ncbi:DUF6258 family protein [Escherichia coli]|nr:DUF6258 family protein [Escherichia coli]
MNLIYGVNKLELWVNLISRIAYGTTEWIFYDNEDFSDGYLVFSDVSFFNITPNGSIPDDYIISIITEIMSMLNILNQLGCSWTNSNTNSGDIDIIGECQIFIRYKHSWIENKFKEKNN